MNHTLSRRHFGAAAVGSIGAAAFMMRPAGAAQFEFKLGHPVPASAALHIRLTQMFADIEKESGGRLHVTIHPNNELGASVDEIAQCRLGAIQFVCAAEANLANLTPAPGILNTGFAFKTSNDVHNAMAGPLGFYLLQQIASVGLVTFPTLFDSGIRTMSSSRGPIKVADDMNGLKVRVPTTKIMVDLFKTLGASPTALDLSQVYSGLQTHLIDGTELPVPLIEDMHLYEVQKFVSVTNHAWSGFFFITSTDTWKSLPTDIQGSLRRGVAKYSALQTKDSQDQSKSLIATLAGARGMTVTQSVDPESFRKMLAPYYARWKETFTPPVWAMLEKTVGKLG